jgi:hypothetical protein
VEAKRDFHKAGDVENRLGYYVGQLGSQELWPKGGIAMKDVISLAAAIAVMGLAMWVLHYVVEL